MITTISDERLLSWNQLRQQTKNVALEHALEEINNWWQLLPIDNAYLHWEDDNNWPDPWTLIADGIFCDLSKALGIVYTVFLLERSDVNSVELAQSSEGDYLVLINKGKYILNWAPQTILNTTTLQPQIVSTIDASVVTKKIS